MTGISRQQRVEQRHGISSQMRWLGADMASGRFFEGDGVGRRIAPFVAAGTFPFLVLPLIDVSFTDWRVVAGFMLIPLLVSAIMLTPWHRLPAWCQAVPVLCAFLIIALVRDASGPDAAVFEPLLIIPITWFALYGTRPELGVSALAMTATMVAPVVLIGEPTYDDGQLARAAIVLALVGTTGAAIQTLVMNMRRLAGQSQQILENAQEAFVTVEEDGTIVEWNAQAERIFGWSREEVLGMDFGRTIVRPGDRHAYETLMERLLSKEQSSLLGRRLEGTAVRRDGEELWLEVTVSRLRVGDGWTFNAFLYDVSDRKRSEQALREAEERFRRSFEDSGVGMMIVSPKGEFLRVNQALCEIVGYTAEELTTKRFADITHPDDVGDGLEALRELVDGERDAYRSEKRYLHAEGHSVWISLNVSPIHDEHGEVVHFISQVEDITERKEVEQKLTHQALHDPLTALPNRVLFADRVRMASARRDTGYFAVIYLDLDTFKPINDTLGHSAGDQVLVDVARRLEGLLRDGDTLARLGGDEFAILCEGTGEEEARHIAERVVAAFHEPFEVEGQDIEQAVSVGVSVQPRDGRQADPEVVLRAADLAMYRAKASGKSRYAMYEGWMIGDNSERGQLERELRLAIQRRELTVHYQPEIDLATGSVTGAEALVRWNHPERGLLEPADFMPVAELSDQIVEIDDFVLWEACHQAAGWRLMLDDGEDFVVSVNLSERRLGQPGLSNKIAQAIADSQLPASSLCLEVAERSVLDRRGRAMGAIPDLEELGVRLLIDDFGVAISSFSTIKRLPRLNALKIDSSFTAGLGRSEEDAAGVAAIIGLAHGLKLAATAEGVETAEQVEELRRHGCDRAQGFYFARPQPPAAFAELLEAARYGELLV